MAGKVIRAQDAFTRRPPSGAVYRLIDGDDHGLGKNGFVMSDFPQGTGPGEHRHPFPAVSFVIAGQGVFTIDGEEHVASAGEVVIIASNAWHSIRNDSEELFRVIGVDFGGTPDEAEFRSPDATI